jgi:hypothetical protein
MTPLRKCCLWPPTTQFISKPTILNVFLLQKIEVTGFELRLREFTPAEAAASAGEV